MMRFIVRDITEMSENLEPLLYWVHERESIRLKRVAGLSEPWTVDEILAKYRFCNVRRCDDRVSSWLIANVLTSANMKKAGLSNFLMFSAWCRWVNWPPTIKAVMAAGLFPCRVIDWKKIGQLTDQIARKEKAWTGAYMIRAPKKKGAKKGKFVAEVVVGKNLKAVLPKLLSLLKRNDRTYRAVWELLQTVDGYGSFMAGQIAGDWTYTTLLNCASDLKTFAPMGPGSIRGFNRIMGIKPIAKKPSEELWLAKLQEWRAAVIERLGGGVYESLTALDVQNCLCEGDKWLRVKNEEGRPRANYKPHEY
jgi:hypothetical protein